MTSAERPELSTPALNGLLDFWLSKCDGGTPPVSSSISPAELRPWKDNIVIFEIVGDDDFVYSYYGKALEQAWGHSRLGHTLDALPDDQRRLVRGEYDTALRERLPIARLHTGDFDGATRAFERLVLPLSSDGATVDKLMVCAYEVTGEVTTEPEEPAAADGDVAMAAPPPAPETGNAAVAADKPTETPAETPAGTPVPTEPPPDEGADGADAGHHIDTSFLQPGATA